MGLVCIPHDITIVKDRGHGEARRYCKHSTEELKRMRHSEFRRGRVWTGQEGL